MSESLRNLNTGTRMRAPNPESPTRGDPKVYTPCKPQRRIVAAKVRRQRRQRRPQAVAGDPQRPRLSHLFGPEVCDCPVATPPRVRQEIRRERGRRVQSGTGRNCASTMKSSTDDQKSSTCVPRNASTIASGIDDDVGLRAVLAVKVRDVAGDPGVRERGLHGRLRRVGQQRGISQPPGVARDSSRYRAGIERMLLRSLEERVRLQNISWRIQGTRRSGGAMVSACEILLLSAPREHTPIRGELALLGGRIPRTKKEASPESEPQLESVQQRWERARRGNASAESQHGHVGRGWTDERDLVSSSCRRPSSRVRTRRTARRGPIRQRR